MKLTVEDLAGLFPAGVNRWREAETAKFWAHVQKCDIPASVGVHKLGLHKMADLQLEVIEKWPVEEGMLYNVAFFTIFTGEKKPYLNYNGDHAVEDFITVTPTGVLTPA